MPTMHFFSFIDKVSIIGVSCSAYLYSVYTLLPNHFYEPLVTIFIPAIGIISFLLFPKIKTLKTSNKGSQQVVTQNNEQDTVKEQNVDSQSNIDESFIQAIIDQKISATLKEFSNEKQQLDDSINIINNVKKEMDELKKNVSELKDAFETTLVDLKSFQTEMANPLNFMRKYFESIDVKSFSDPLLPLQTENKNLNDDKEYLIKNDHTIDENDKHNNKEISEISNLAASLNLDYKMSLANIMEVISTLGEFIKIFGIHYRDVLNTQCKILKLKDEQKEMLYSIADILSRSKTSADTYIEELYKLATVMGIKDEKIDAIYTNLRRKKGRRNGL